MSTPATIDEGRALFGDRLIAPTDVAEALGLPCPADHSLPFDTATLRAAAAAGERLIYRWAGPDGDRLTIRRLIELVPQAFDPKFLLTSGYQLKNEWGIELEPLAATDTCQSGWALVQPAVLAESCNLSYPEQEPALRAYEARLGAAAGSLRRRTAIEAVFDTVVWFKRRGERPLETTWDWTSSLTLDGGYLHVGGFGAAGMQILGFSAGIRHDALGVCPTRP